ncbi:pyrC [Wigglesworthia glossinidia endosymbiont of Glossina brevipalpis]|uniref:Dihydroorotase n=1 Tax=Wigglesworthia glossinidia brevipalpis TaxID=36870 RepID=Q8D3B4_WIGBR|nr:pyrC [Wigglesworthia glossinidia endosymbiont of Glossina brevipalpis]
MLLKIIKPDDFHIHLREKEILKKILPYTSQFFGRALVMPNLNQPIINSHFASVYKKEICSFIPKLHKFNPLMTLYLTENCDKKMLVDGFLNKIFIAAKMYISNTTTNSEKGIKNFENIFHILEIMQKIGMILSVHGEISDEKTDIFDREAKFIEKVMIPIRKNFPKLKIVFEHISTKIAVEYVISEDSLLGATITPHHLMFNYNDMLSNKIKPHLYCFPILKKKIDQFALHKAISGNCNRFFLGTDSAPHVLKNKESSMGFAGIFNSPIALEMYATVFDNLNILNKLENFCSINGANFYNLPINKEHITFFKETFYPNKKQIIKINKNNYLSPIFFEKKLNWKIKLKEY